MIKLSEPHYGADLGNITQKIGDKHAENGAGGAVRIRKRECGMGKAVRNRINNACAGVYRVNPIF